MEERLRSRLAGDGGRYSSADYELRLGILQSKAEQAQVDISDKVLEFMAHRIVSNVRELEGALNVFWPTMLIGQEITIDSTLIFWPICCAPVAGRSALMLSKSGWRHVMVCGCKCFQRDAHAILPAPGRLPVFGKKSDLAVLSGNRPQVGDRSQP